MTVEAPDELPVIQIPEEFQVGASPWLQPILNEVLLLPIARQRLRAFHATIWAELKGRADTNGTTPEYELCREASQALSLVISGLEVPTRLFDPYDPSSPKAAEYVRERIQQRINDEVTKALLGPAWRLQERELPPEETHGVSDPRKPYETNLLVAGLLNDARLSSKERELLQAYRKHGRWSDSADELGIAHSTAGTMAQRIRKKLSVPH